MPPEDAGAKPEIKLYLTEDQYRLILDEVYLLPADIRRKLAGAPERDAMRVVSATQREFGDLADCVAFLSNHTEDRGLERRLDELWSRLTGALEAVANVSPLTGGVGVALGTSLSEHQVMRLLQDWDGPDAAVRLSPDLGLEDVSSSVEFRNARIVLRAIADAGTVKATASKNLSRAFCSQMLDALDLEPGRAEAIRSTTKALNEIDAGPLQRLRVTCQGARLIALRKGQFSLTKRGADLLQDRRSGELFAVLFRTYFRVVNWSGFHRWGWEVDHLLQPAAGMFLFLISQFGDGWCDVEDVGRVCVPTAVVERLPGQPFITAGRALRTTVLQALEWYGLVELSQTGRPPNDSWAMRRTPLYGKFLSFDPGPHEAPETP